MKLPPLDKSGAPFLGSVKYDFAYEDSAGSYEIRDEAAGSFVILRSEGAEGLRFDADELVALAAWAQECCAEMDEFNSKAEK